jgi:hypothetical protein
MRERTMIEQERQVILFKRIAAARCRRAMRKLPPS